VYVRGEAKRRGGVGRKRNPAHCGSSSKSVPEGGIWAGHGGGRRRRSLDLEARAGRSVSDSPWSFAVGSVSPGGSRDGGEQGDGGGLAQPQRVRHDPPRRRRPRRGTCAPPHSFSSHATLVSRCLRVSVDLVWVALVGATLMPAPTCISHVCY
jgi:hypothetical protein